jgi:hypothetical protein
MRNNQDVNSWLDALSVTYKQLESFSQYATNHITDDYQLPYNLRAKEGLEQKATCLFGEIIWTLGHF